MIPVKVKLSICIQLLIKTKAEMFTTDRNAFAILTTPIKTPRSVNFKYERLGSKDNKENNILRRKPPAERGRPEAVCRECTYVHTYLRLLNSNRPK